jgi:hypothetical protein
VAVVASDVQLLLVGLLVQAVLVVLVELAAEVQVVLEQQTLV